MVYERGGNPDPPEAGTTRFKLYNIAAAAAAAAWNI